MSFLPRIRRILRIDRPSLRAQAAREVEEELAFHFETRVRDLMADPGLSREEAAARVRAEFGDVDVAAKNLRRETRRAVRRIRIGETLDRVWRELRFAARRLRRQPMFTCVAAFTLALGIGATTAMFSVIDGVLLRPLPYDDADRLVSLSHSASGPGRERMGMSTGFFYTYVEENRVFEDVGLWDNGQVTVTGLAEPERLDHLIVSHQVLSLLRVRPAAGRFFSPEDDQPGQPLTAVISHPYWEARFGGDPSIAGHTLTVNGAAVEIIGVLPASFRFPGHRPDVLFPSRLDRLQARVSPFQQQAVARLRPRVSLEDAIADMERMLPLSVEEFGPWTQARLREIGLAPTVHPLKTEVIGQIDTALWMVFGAVGILLIIASANVANLFLVRAEGRNQEVAVRAALGAGRGGVARELGLEGLALGLLGGTLALGVAYGGLELLKVVGSETIPRMDQIALDRRALWFSVGVTLLTVVAFSLLPVLRYSKPDLTAALRGRSRGTSSARNRSRGALATAQVALALVLLIGAGLMFRTFEALRNVDPGFERPEEVLTFRLFIPSAEVPDLEAAVRTHGCIVEEIERIPGVVSASVTNSVPLDGRNNNSSVHVADAPVAGGEVAPSRRHKFVLPGYLDTIENPLLAGRGITWDDILQRRTVAVVTEDFALEYWRRPSEAVGKRIREAVNAGWKEIVGVVGAVHDDGLDRGSTAILYWPLLVSDFWGMEQFGFRSVVYVVRTEGPHPETRLEEIRRAVWSVNPNLPLANIATLRAIVDRSTARTSFTVVLLGVAAAVALVLGLVGLYGVVSYTVSLRTREIGIRMALGARREDVTGMIVRQGLMLAGTGILVGLAAAAVLTRLMSSLLFRVEALDPWTFGLTAGALVGVALLASYAPARRAATVDPVHALRQD